MYIINKTGHTINIDNDNHIIPYLQNQEQQYINLDLVKKNIGLKRMILQGKIIINKHQNSIYQINLKKQQGTMKINKNQIQNNIIQSNNIQIKLKGVFDLGGFGNVNINLAKGLSNLGIKVQIDPISGLNNLSQKNLIQLGKLRNSVSKNAIVIDSVIPVFGQQSYGKNYKILNTTIQSSTIPKQFIDMCNNYNQIWVNSDFAKQILLKYNIKKQIFVFPNTFSEIYNENIQPYNFNPKLNNFVFLTVGGYGYRKGFDALFKAYIQQFNKTDPVSLLVVSKAQGKAQRSQIIKTDIQNYIKKYNPNNAPHIARYSQNIPEDIMPKIYKACNGFVLTSRGQSFGNPYVQAAKVGLPIIATNYSGHTMFLKQDNSTLVDIDKLQILQQGTSNIHYWDNQLFPSLKTQDFNLRLRKSMRYVYQNYQECKIKNKKLQKIIDQYSIQKVCKNIKLRLQFIKNNYCPKIK